MIKKEKEYMQKSNKREGRGLPRKRKSSKRKISAFAELKKHSQKVGNHQDSLKEEVATTFLYAGKLNEAENIYQQLIEEGSQNHLVYGNLAVIYLAKGHKEGAINLLKQAIKIKPNYPEAHNHLGVVLKGQGDHKAAISSYQQAIKLKPRYPEAHNNLGNALQEQGNLIAAISSYQQAIKYKSNFHEAHYNLGNSLQEQGDFSSAISSYQQAIKLQPVYPKAYNNLGNALQERGDFSAAISSYQQAIKLQPSYPESYNNLGNALQREGYLSAAISSFQKAIELQPIYPVAHYNLGLAFLLHGNYQLGWLEYEYRFKQSKQSLPTHAHPKIPKWQGENLDLNEQLLVVSEQGLGDTLQFMRYIPYLRQKNIDVSFCTLTKLHELIKASEVTSNPLSLEQGNTVKKGKWIPLLSVPQFLDVTPENPVVTYPYIHSSISLKNQWKKILSQEKSPIIGINWQGNPKAEMNYLKGRSIPLEAFATIAKNYDCTYLSLQKGYGSEQLETCSFKDRFVHCQDQVNETWSFLETAAIIANCDLIITCDTYVTHLAAGLGKETWCLLHNVPDWRWGLYGKRTFWYPSMKLFRQKERNNWTEVMDRVLFELKTLVF